MRGFRRMLAIVLAGALLACGGGAADPETTAVASDTPTTPPEPGADLVALLSRSEGFGEAATTVVDGRRLVYGGIASSSSDQPATPVDGGILVDAEGRITSVPPAPIRGLAQLSASSQNGRALVLGSPCGRNAGYGDTGDLECEPGGWALASFDVRTGTWTELDLPPSIADPDSEWDTVTVHGLEGSVIAIVAAGPDRAAATDRPSRPSSCGSVTPQGAGRRPRPRPARPVWSTGGW